MYSGLQAPKQENVRNYSGVIVVKNPMLWSISPCPNYRLTAGPNEQTFNSFKKKIS